MGGVCEAAACCACLGGEAGMAGVDVDLTC